MYIIRGRATEEGKGARGQIVIMTQRRLEELWRKLDSMQLAPVKYSRLINNKPGRSRHIDHRLYFISTKCFPALARVMTSVWYVLVDRLR
jgi:hypothetical protein